MKEKVLTGKKHGMAALLGIMLLFILAFAAVIFGAVMIENEENQIGRASCRERVLSHG